MKLFTRQVQRAVSASHLSAGRPRFLMPKRAAMRPFARIVRRVPLRFFRLGVEPQGDVEHAFAAAAHQRQRAVRGDGAMVSE
jgi:hypothetical protein